MNRWDEEYRSGAHWETDKPSSHMARLKKYLTPECLVLDAGCGSGKDAIFLSSQGYRVFGIDISEEAISKAREKMKEERLNVPLDVGKLESMPYKDGFFDIVYSGYVIHHTDISLSIPEISRILKSDGIFYCVMFEEIKYEATSELDETIERQKLLALLNIYFKFIEMPEFNSYEEEDQHGKHSHKRIRFVCAKKSCAESFKTPNNPKSLHYDGRHYDLQYGHIDDDVGFYLSHIEKHGGPVLELACGTGRVTIPIARKGIEIVGLDNSGDMLARAKEKAAKERLSIEWAEADCRDFDLGRKFKAIIFPWNSLAHLLDDESALACFACARKHLADDGIFMLEIWNPRPEFLSPESTKPAFEYDNPDGRGRVAVTGAMAYDEGTRLNRITWRYKLEGEPEEIVEEMLLRMYFPEELDALLSRSGLEILSKYGNYDESPFTEASPRQLVVCGKS